MSTAADAALPQFRLCYSIPLYHPSLSIAGSASACSTMTNSSFQSQLPSPRRSSSSQLVSPAPSWDPTETRQSWGNYETSNQESTYAAASTLVYQHHNQTATSITYSFQPPRTESYAHSPPTNIYNVSQTPSFTQHPHTPTPKSSSLPFLPHHPVHPHTLTPLEHNIPLPLDRSLETVDPRPYLQFLASKTPPPEKPLPPHPEPVTSILIHQRTIPPRTVNDSEIVKTDSAQPATFACLSMDSDFSASMLDLGIKSSAASPLTTCFAQGQNPWHSNLTVGNATAQDRSHGPRSAGLVSVKSSEMIFNDHFHSLITVPPPPVSLCLSPTTPIKFQFADHQQGELEFQSQPQLPPGIQLQLQGPTIPISSCPITQPASPTRSSRPLLGTRSHSYPNDLGSFPLTSIPPMIHTPVHTIMASERHDRINEHGFTTSGFNNSFHSSSTTVRPMSGTPHLSATAPSELDLNGQPNESELQLRCHSDQSGHRPLMTMEPMNIVPVADNSTPRTGRTLSGLKRRRSFNGQSSKACKGGEKKRMRRTLSGLKHFVSALRDTK
ncbi:hypothetical protein I307_01739 [Cryptococcus deuterogattii 99/473]|uniref:Uncharacterized protein n=1 Tax=Cryptococcus deuterogattii Ram5 TaxID=1296110 RepID=A0A0D0UXW0_9TREE|nr:hypothetical protein I313_05173 [Cryptococcus deuterogattii Ram5]KIY58937.1 hypothetical protein I307_01739 [Cryptococcus deuterogattii 99/473]